MNALLFEGPEKVVYGSLPDPRIESPGDVVVKMSCCAICGSDLHVYHGREMGCDTGTAMGHEFVGVVEETGASVKALKRGDRVMSPFTTNCGECYYCRSGLTARCIRGQLFGWREKGRGLHGAQAGYVRVPLADTTLVQVPEGTGDELALLYGDILSTAFFCSDNAGAGQGKTHVVVGCGPVGLLTVVAARLRGAEKIFAVDAVPARLRLAEEWGAVPVDLRTSDAIQVVKEATEGRGADCVMEAVGSPQAIRSAFDLLRPGGTLSSVGVNTSRSYPFTPEEVYNKNATFRSGRCPARRYMTELIQMSDSLPADITRVFSHRMNLGDGAEGYRKFAAREDGCLKVLLTP
jgi:threonine dehydrogenase-like Zn-dependent dehydrogenase